MTSILIMFLGLMLMLSQAWREIVGAAVLKRRSPDRPQRDIEKEMNFRAQKLQKLFTFLFWTGVAIVMTGVYVAVGWVGLVFVLYLVVGYMVITGIAKLVNWIRDRIDNNQ